MWGPAVHRPVWGTEELHPVCPGRRGKEGGAVRRIAHESQILKPTFDCVTVEDWAGRAGNRLSRSSSHCIHKNLTKTTDHHQSPRESIIYFVC